MSRALDLSGRAVFVTGPAKGMGGSISRALAEAGADLALAGRDLAAIEPVAEAARALGRRVETIPCDVTDEASVEAAAARAWAALGPGDWGLVNVAGTTGPFGKAIWEHELGEVREVFEVNLFGSFLTMKAWLPRMIAQGRGAVVNIGGTFGFKGVRNAWAYGATKWSLRGLTRSAALEVGGFGVRVNMVSPGGVDGPRLADQLGRQAERDGRDAAEVYAAFAGSTALGRMSRDADVADAVLFLLSGAARNITGQDLLVDGGTIL